MKPPDVRPRWKDAAGDVHADLSATALADVIAEVSS